MNLAECLSQFSVDTSTPSAMRPWVQTHRTRNKSSEHYHSAPFRPDEARRDAEAKFSCTCVDQGHQPSSERGLEEMAEVGLGNRTPPYPGPLPPLVRLPQRTKLNQACSDHQLSRLQPTTPPLVAAPPQLPLRLHRSPAPQEHPTLLKCNRFFMCNFNFHLENFCNVHSKI